MKIRTKLFIAFFLLIGLPMLLFSAGVITFTQYHMDELYALQVETATIEEIPYPVLHKITARITAEVEGINRVLFDLTPKPTGTIEWE